jgi:LmbE family N-acetylglucosaminyl deacetylase
MSHPYLGFVTAFAEGLVQARHLPLGGFPAPDCPPLAPDPPVTLVFSPHPDDESIIGALPLRLRREGGHRVLVVAVTQGSRVERRTERLEEMRGACGFLGFDLMAIGEQGLSGITPTGRASDPVAWKDAVALVARLLQDQRPAVIVLPHAGDSHPTHQGTHLLVLDALRSLGPAFTCAVILTEFWAALPDPNLMVESTPAEVADLMAAVSFHRGEVLRNPYHVLLPSWMSDNVRRGSELVGEPGDAAPEWPFATLYRQLLWDGTSLVAADTTGRRLPAGSEPGGLFRP